MIHNNEVGFVAKKGDIYSLGKTMEDALNRLKN